MKNKLLLIFSFMLCVMNNSYGSEWDTLRKVGIVVGLGAILKTGLWAEELNKRYAEKGWDPDFRLYFSKAIGAAGLLLAADVLTGDTSDTKLNLCKLAAATISLLATTDTAGYMIKDIPVVNGILTNPRPNGKEQNGPGRYWRGLLVCMPLRAVLIRYLVPHAGLYL